MKRSLLFLFCLPSLLFAGPIGGGALSGDLALLQGTWQLVSGIKDGVALSPKEIADTRIVTSGNTYFFPASYGIGTSQSGTFTLNEKVLPKQVDATTSDGTLVLGIYRIDGSDTYTAVFAAPGAARPSDFTSVRGSGNSLQVWRRVMASNPFAKLSSRSTADDHVTLKVTNKCTYPISLAHGASLERDASQNYAAIGWWNIDAGQSTSIDLGDSELPYFWLLVEGNNNQVLTRNDASLCGDPSLKFGISRIVKDDGTVEFSGSIGANPERRGTTCDGIGGQMLSGFEQLPVTGTSGEYIIDRCQ